MAKTQSSRSRLNENIIKALEPRATRYDVRDDKNIGLVLRVAPSGRKTWSLSYRNERGRQQRYTLGIYPNVKLARARELATVKLGEVAGNTDIAAERRETRQQEEAPTLKEFVDGTYSDYVEAHQKSSYTTLHRLQHVLPWGKRRLDQITPKLVEGWCTRRINAGLAPATVNRDIAALKSCLSKAVEWHLLDVHPLAGLKKLEIPDEKRVRYLSPAEEKRLRKALQSKATPDFMPVLVLLALNTGLRRGELLALDWSAVNLKSKMLTVTASTAKSSKVRHVPLNKKAVALLKDWQKQASSEGRVFNLKRFQGSWDALRWLAELEDFRFHDLRHTFASKLVMAGIDLNTVRELLGHSDIKMTLRYAHLAPEHKAAAVEVL